MAPHCTSGRKSHRARGAGASGRRTAVTGSKPRQKEPLCSFRDEDFEDFEDFEDSGNGWHSISQSLPVAFAGNIECDGIC